MSSLHPKAITDTWLQDLKPHADANLRDAPNYWANSPSTLITTSQPVHFTLGTGSQILSSAFSTCASAEHELIIVTCFWAKSRSQEDLSSFLLKLSAKAVSRNRKIQVRLCFSSLSLFQKLWQTSSLDGKIYPPSTWVNLGLPPPEELMGLEIVVKSVFVRPFSVMHPKFILVDRKISFMPSCNVSWEDWFEGCIEMRGDIALKLYDFWDAFWAKDGTGLPSLPAGITPLEPTASTAALNASLIKRITFPPDTPPVQTVLLPSPHHANLILHPLSTSTPPPTPLNAFILHIIKTATRSIFIQTPNLTCSPLIMALVSALERGIEVHLITSSRLMILEQLVTAGTITEFEVWKLRRQCSRLLNTYNLSMKNPDLENPLVKPGNLKVGYFTKRASGEDEPVKSHLKMVLVDGEITVLGSGNMDRASWFTSQELGVALFGRGVAQSIRVAVDEGLEGRVAYIT
jgi:phosphatidylserine/phosphatidylglycerophosphate/cardiolipin synthase-like enzyme